MEIFICVEFVCSIHLNCTYVYCNYLWIVFDLSYSRFFQTQHGKCVLLNFVTIRSSDDDSNQSNPPVIKKYFKTNVYHPCKNHKFQLYHFISIQTSKRLPTIFISRSDGFFNHFSVKKYFFFLQNYTECSCKIMLSFSYN